MAASPDRQAVYDELERVRRDFAALTAAADADKLKAPSDGTRWTNQELLYHMVFGYLVTRTLFPLVRLFALLPRPTSQAFAALLNVGTPPFDVANYIASVLGARVLNPAHMNWLLNRITTQLATRLAGETERGLGRGMHFPTRWDPFFTDYMTISDLYRYPTQHYDFHRTQLTL